jgi:hypothetical protein
MQGSRDTCLRHDARTSSSVSAKVRPGCSVVTSAGSGVVRSFHHDVDGRSGLPTVKLLERHARRGHDHLLR